MATFFKYIAPLQEGNPHRVVGIKPNNYSSQLSQIQAMADIVNADFPGIAEGIHAVAYDGDRWKRQMGIEFLIPADCPVPSDYFEVSSLEYTFAGN